MRRTLILVCSALLLRLVCPAAPQIRVGSVLGSRSDLVHFVRPVYPLAARKLGITGVVRMRCRIDLKGRVRDIEVLSGPEILRSAALVAVRQWIYKPTRIDGHPLDVITPVDIPFTLSQ